MVVVIGRENPPLSSFSKGGRTIGILTMLFTKNKTSSPFVKGGAEEDLEEKG
jgi:hypothetical protein